MVVIAYIVDRIEYAYIASKPPAGARTFTSSVELASMRHEINVFERSVETDLNRLLGGGNSEHYDSYVDAWNQPTQFRGGIPWDLLTLPGDVDSDDDDDDNNVLFTPSLEREVRRIFAANHDGIARRRGTARPYAFVLRDISLAVPLHLPKPPPVADDDDDNAVNTEESAPTRPS